MVQMRHREVKQGDYMVSQGEAPTTQKQRFITRTRLIILLIAAVVDALVGRATVRLVLNLLLGGTMWGGNFL